MNKRILAICLILAMLLTGCMGKQDVSRNTAEDTKIQIGFSFDNFVVERWQRDRDVFVSAAKELGAEVNVQNANGDVEKQIETIQYFIDKKVDVIVVVPIQAGSLQEVIKKAKDKGIKVISYDRPALESDVDLYISFDNEMVGTLMGGAFTKVLSREDKVLMICGSKEDNNVTLVEKGFRDVMNLSGNEILDVAYMDNWKAELVSEYMSQHKDLVSQATGIMCGNDDLAREVVRFLSENRMAGRVYIVGQDADLNACQRIVSDMQYMTVFKPMEKLAVNAAEAAVKLAKGEELPVTETFFDGKYDVLYWKMEPIAVTKENMDEVIIGTGFHLKEDIYLDRPVEE